LERPRAGFVPFTYPDYPPDMIDRFVKESESLVRDLGIDVVSTRPVVVYEDVSRAIEDLRKERIDFILALIVSWVEAPNFTAVLKGFFQLPILLWSHTRFREKDKLLTLGALPAAGVLRETLEEMRAKFKFIYGMPDEDRVRREIAKFSRVAYAVSRLDRSKIGLLGYASMGMYTATFDHLAVRNRLGPEIQQIDQYELIRKVDEVDESSVMQLIRKMRDEWEISPRVAEKDLKTTARMYLSLKEMIKRLGWDALTVKCQYELSRSYGFAPCIPLSMLGAEVTCSCEGDVPLIITQLMMHYLTGKTIAYGDVHALDEDSLVLAACGFAPLDLASGKPKVDKHTAICEGLLNSSQYKTGRVTLARLASSECGYKMHIASGEAGVPEPFNEVGCPPYPSMSVKLDGSVPQFADRMMSQHYAIVYADIKDELLELCRLLDIDPIVI
jgi:L-fucose isomerase-like protein